MANFSPTPSCSSGSTGSDSTLKNDMNGNAEQTGSDPREDLGAFGHLGNGTSNDSHGGARPKVRRPVDLNGMTKAVDSNGVTRPAVTLNGRTNGTTPGSDDDQKVPSMAYNSQDSQNGQDFDSDNDDPANQDSDTNDDLYVYTYKGFGDASSRDDYEADLPKSFYQLDVGSDSESGAPSQGVSGPGQSNLSTEVAAALLIQSEMASNRRRRNQAVPPSGRDSPDMDFLEMDFDPGESDEDFAMPPEQRQQRAQEQQLDVASSNADIPHPIEDTPTTDGAAAALPNGVENVPERPNYLVDVPENFDGISSAPLQSPAEHSIDNCMVRSQSLNSPLARQKFISRLEPCMLRGESDPGGGLVGCTGPRNKRRHSGEGGALCHSSSSSSAGNSSLLFSDPLVNMEVCGARLSQREALLFGIPGSSATNLRRAVPKLRMIDTTTTPTDEDQNPCSVLTVKTDCLSPGWLDGNCDSETSSSDATVEKTMIWTELEACKRQVSQIGVSACGATAVINVLQALEWPHSVEQVVEAVPTRYRAERESVPKYLFSRSVAGTSHKDLIEAVDRISSGQIYGRFFAMFPRRKFHLSRWLRDWINLGAVPLATLNLQRGAVRPGQTIPDAWHHQMIFGVGPSGVYLTNPLENVPEEMLLEQLSSPSELLVRRCDVTARTSGDVIARGSAGFVDVDCDLSLLTRHDDQRWDHLNVLGQVVNVLREEQALRRGPPAPAPGKATQTSHVRIPAIYQSGITLFVAASNELCFNELRSASELQIQSTPDVARVGDDDNDAEEVFKGPFVIRRISDV